MPGYVRYRLKDKAQSIKPKTKEKMKKNPFKKQGAMDTLVNVGVGGAANVAFDMLYNSVIEGMDERPSDTVENGIKLAIGILGGTMTNNKYIGAATHGIAVVGVSNLVAGLMDDTTDNTNKDKEGEPEKTSGLAPGTIGRARLGNPTYRRMMGRRSVNGLGNFMSE